MASNQSAATSPGRRRGRPPRDLRDDSTPREKLLRAAEAVVAKHGVHGFRLSDVAAQLGVQVPSLYNHFASRDDLLVQLAAQLSDDFLKSGAAQRVRGGDAMEILRRQGDVEIIGPGVIDFELHVTMALSIEPLPDTPSTRSPACSTSIGAAHPSGASSALTPSTRSR